MKNFLSLSLAAIALVICILGCAGSNTDTSEANRPTPKSFVSSANASPSPAANITSPAFAEKNKSSNRTVADKKNRGGNSALEVGESWTTAPDKAEKQNGSARTSKREYYPPASRSGDRIVSPEINQTGATAECRDGSLSYSAHRRGTCSHHGGVAFWY